MAVVGSQTPPTPHSHAKRHGSGGSLATSTQRPPTQRWPRPQDEDTATATGDDDDESDDDKDENDDDDAEEEEKDEVEEDLEGKYEGDDGGAEAVPQGVSSGTASQQP